MITVPVIKSFLAVFILALTPVQCWEAARRFNSNFMAEGWFILVGIIAMAILTVLLFVVSFKRTMHERKSSEKLFLEYAEKRGLTALEHQTLLETARKARLKRSESIFTLATAFDRGTAKMKENLVGQQAAKERKHLETILSSLREKLGFEKESSYSRGMSAKSKRLSSRQIPVDKTVRVTRRKTEESEAIEATVVKNGDTELTVRLTTPVTITFGEYWNVRYYFSTSIWEFDTSVISYDGDILVLNHSDNIRFINRRRFLRVPVRKPAFIACFPFAKSSEPLWGAPEFVPAIVTELAGPGLRIESRLEVEEGERVLVVFSLDEEQSRDLTTSNAAILKVVEDIGVVRHTKAIPNGLSIAVELTGLSDSNVDELVRVTNAALIKTGAGNKNAPASTSEEEHMVKPVATQGV